MQFAFKWDATLNIWCRIFLSEARLNIAMSKSAGCRQGNLYRETIWDCVCGVIFLLADDSFSLCFDAFVINICHKARQIVWNIFYLIFIEIRKVRSAKILVKYSYWCSVFLALPPADLWILYNVHHCDSIKWYFWHPFIFSSIPIMCFDPTQISWAEMCHIYGKIIENSSSDEYGCVLRSGVVCSRPGPVHCCPNVGLFWICCHSKSIIPNLVLEICFCVK